MITSINIHVVELKFCSFCQSPTHVGLCTNSGDVGHYFLYSESDTKEGEEGGGLRPSQERTRGERSLRPVVE